MAPPLWQKAKRNKGASWWSEKAGLKLNIKKAEILASGPIISWQIVEEAIETGDNLFSWAPKSLKMLTSNEIKRCLLLEWKVMTNPDRILKSRDITLPTKVCLVKAMVSPVVMYGCESWTIKKAEHRRIDAFELQCWRRLSRVPWLQGDPTSPFWRRSVLNIHWKDWCWNWNSNTLDTWCEELTHLKRP